ERHAATRRQEHDTRRRFLSSGGLHHPAVIAPARGLDDAAVGPLNAGILGEHQLACREVEVVLVSEGPLELRAHRERAVALEARGVAGAVLAAVTGLEVVDGHPWPFIALPAARGVDELRAVRAERHRPEVARPEVHRAAGLDV